MPPLVATTSGSASATMNRDDTCSTVKFLKAVAGLLQLLE